MGLPFRLQLHCGIQHSMRDFPFARLWHSLSAAMREDGHSVALRVKSDARLRNIVEHDGVQSLALQLLARVG